jgi:serine O-acetyltransferase
MARKDFFTSLLYLRRSKLLGKAAYIALKMFGVEAPLAVQVGEGCLLVHGGYGVVIHPQTVIGDRVKIYPGVTLGRADVHLPIEQSRFEGIRVECDVLLGAGAKVLCREGVLTIGAGAVIGANAVVLESVGAGETWAGVPARLVGRRKNPLA